MSNWDDGRVYMYQGLPIYTPLTNFVTSATTSATVTTYDDQAEIARWAAAGMEAPKSKKKESAMEWLDRRINEMRIAL